MYTLNKESLASSALTITHENVNTKEVEGIMDEENKVIAIQYEPVTMIDENSENIYAQFANLMKQSGGKNNA